MPRMRGPVIEPHEQLVTYFRNMTLHVLMHAHTRVARPCGCEVLLGAGEDDEPNIVTGACELHEAPMDDVVRKLATLGAHNVTPEQADAILGELIC